jgi:hypothetical protein
MIDDYIDILVKGRLVVFATFLKRRVTFNLLFGFIVDSRWKERI